MELSCETNSRAYRLSELELVDRPPANVLTLTDTTPQDEVVDIIFVHGLAESSDVQPRLPLSWLLELSARHLPSTRILTFGYDGGEILRSPSAISEFAIDLLNGVYEKRAQKSKVPPH